MSGSTAGSPIVASPSRAASRTTRWRSHAAETNASRARALGVSVDSGEPAHTWAASAHERCVVLHAGEHDVERHLRPEPPHLPERGGPRRHRPTRPARPACSSRPDGSSRAASAAAALARTNGSRSCMRGAAAWDAASGGTPSVRRARAVATRTAGARSVVRRRTSGTASIAPERASERTASARIVASSSAPTRASRRQERPDPEHGRRDPAHARVGISEAPTATSRARHRPAPVRRARARRIRTGRHRTRGAGLHGAPARAPGVGPADADHRDRREHRRGQTDEVEHARSEGAFADERDHAGEDRADLRRPAVDERPGLITSIGRHRADHGLGGLEAPPWSHATCANLKTMRVAKPSSIASTANATT